MRGRVAEFYENATTPVELPGAGLETSSAASSAEASAPSPPSPPGAGASSTGVQWPAIRRASSAASLWSTSGTRRGHQFTRLPGTSPRKQIEAGTTMERIIKVSTRTPTNNVKPYWFITRVLGTRKREGRRAGWGEAMRSAMEDCAQGSTCGGGHLR